jgi:hypothetical protein
LTRIALANDAARSLTKHTKRNFAPLSAEDTDSDQAGEDIHLPGFTGETETMKTNWNTVIEVLPLGVATVAFSRAEEDLIDACGDKQEGGCPDFAPIHARLHDVVAALEACGVDPYEEGREAAEEANIEAADYWEHQAQEEQEPNPYDGTYSEI